MKKKIESAQAALAAIAFVAVVSLFSSFASQHLVSAETLKENAVKIDVAAAPAATPASATSEAAAAPAAKVEGPEPVLAMIATADVARGKTLAKVCMTCHVFDDNGKNGVGPNLHGIVGRKKMSVSGFTYSGSLADQGGDVWTYAEINKFIWKPKAYAAKTKMTYAGMKKAEDRAAVLAFLGSLSNAPAPSAADIEKEAKGLGK